MKRILTVVAVLLLAFLAGAWVISTLAFADDNSNDNNVAVLDDCLPGDAAWNPTGGCTLKPHQGDVSFLEFGALLFSPSYPSIVGHPSWRNEPSHLTARLGQKMRVTNKGGRGHTFTEVANFGGGFVPLLNGAVAPPAPAHVTPLTPAPECNPASPNLIGLDPGQTVQLKGLGPGLHRFQCCIHPWMRATVRVD